LTSTALDIFPELAIPSWLSRLNRLIAPIFKSRLGVCNSDAESKLKSGTLPFCNGFWEIAKVKSVLPEEYLHSMIKKGSTSKQRGGSVIFKSWLIPNQAQTKPIYRLHLQITLHFCLEFGFYINIT
jgi:hypothetical protein